MIPSLPALALLGSVVASAQDVAPAQPPAPPELPPADDVLTPYRLPFDKLVERTIGTTSVPVAFDWRESRVQFAGNLTYLAELNNFNGMRGGGLVRVPAGGTIFEIGVNYAETWESPTSRLLALTPYRQPGHPDRLEVDLTFGIPLAEGVVTAAPKFFPASQLVFNAYGGLRYILYPTGFAGLTRTQVLESVIAPTMSTEEVDNLDDARLPGMKVDPGRYGVMLGFGTDLYFKTGFFVSPRFMLAVPLLSPATQTELYMWADLSLAIGVAL